ncbi:MAG: ornithine acetyltransferase [Sulfuricurvum sp. PC08-66]|nr:MAG: ornithine acetyltransferase [Sulfuricurvum sp. PC08-66]
MPSFTPNTRGVCATPHIYADGLNAGLKTNGNNDLAFIYSDVVCEVAALFTTNKMLAAPLQHAKAKGKIKSNFILVNSKNANAVTGTKGIADIDTIMEQLQAHFGGKLVSPLMSSTGVIGVYLPIEKIVAGAKRFDLTRQEPMNAAHAIMTTDKFSKTIAFDVTCDDGSVFHIGAMAKGAGMINPAMATMLCFITTDINLPQEQVQTILTRVNHTTFNAASVDGDTSTNDTVFVFNTRQSSATDASAFEAALYKVMYFLARELVRDGEGSTKLIDYRVIGAANDREAEIVAKMMSNSLLIKTALYGEDPNWGRIAMSVGASGVACQESTLTIRYNDVVLLDKGINRFDALLEKRAAAVMKLPAFTVEVDLGMGNGTFTAFGCDLNHEYITINADYRT